MDVRAARASDGDAHGMLDHSTLNFVVADNGRKDWQTGGIG